MCVFVCNFDYIFLFGFFLLFGRYLIFVGLPFGYSFWNLVFFILKQNPVGVRFAGVRGFVTFFTRREKWSWQEFSWWDIYCFTGWSDHICFG